MPRDVHRTRRASRVSFGLVPVLVVLLAACSDGAPTGISPTAPAVAGRTADAVPAVQAGEMSMDEEFVRITRDEIPGFAGHYLDEQGGVVVLLTNANSRAAAERHGAQVRARFRSGRSGPPVVRYVAFDFVQLKDWQDKLSAELGSTVRAALDIDEVKNRIWAAVESPTEVGAVRRAAVRMGIPSSAVEVEVRRLPQPRTTLQDLSPTKVAGIQIVNSNWGACSLGFNAVYQGQAVFVTASHCTTTTFGSDGGSIYQPAPSTANLIGTEVWDRTVYLCQSFSICRFSDAAIIGYAGGVPSGLGVVAWPIEMVYGRDGSLELGDPAYISTKWTAAIPVGTSIAKVGRTTGATYGWVTRSCVKIEKIACSYVSDVWSKGGDSGSPILLLNPPNPGLGLTGVLWGGPVDVWNETWFSALAGVERDLGASLTVCYPGWGC